MFKEAGGAPLSASMSSTWDSARSYLRVMVCDLVTEAKVGLHSWEQHPERPNRLTINIEMFATLPSVQGGGLQGENRDGIINYDHIRDALKTWPSRPHTPLLETLLDELVQLCFQSRRVEACRVSILKPDIFNEARGAGVEVYMRRSDYERAA